LPAPAFSLQHFLVLAGDVELCLGIDAPVDAVSLKVVEHAPIEAAVLVVLALGLHILARDGVAIVIGTPRRLLGGNYAKG
jgi:hypothetical protein